MAQHSSSRARCSAGSMRCSPSGCRCRSASCGSSTSRMAISSCSRPIWRSSTVNATGPPSVVEPRHRRAGRCSSLGYALQRGLLNFTLGGGHPAAAARDLRHFGHHPERAAARFSMPAPIACRRRPIETDSVGIGGIVVGCLSADRVRDRDAIDRRAAALVLSHRASAVPSAPPRTTPTRRELMGIDNRHLYALGLAIAMIFTAVAGVLMAVRIDLRSGGGADAPHLRLRGGDHRRARQPVGDLAGRHGAGHRPVGRLGAVAQLADPRRPYRLSRHSRVAAPAASFRERGIDGRRHGRALDPREPRFRHCAAAGLSSRWRRCPDWSGPGTMRLVSEMGYYLALAQLWNLLAGYAGLVSVGQQAYVGIGGYVAVLS